MNTEIGLYKSGFFPTAHIDLSGCKERRRDDWRSSAQVGNGSQSVVATRHCQSVQVSATSSVFAG